MIFTHQRSTARLLRSLHLGLLLALSLSLSLIGLTRVSANQHHDLGDAPDSTNHGGVVMSTFGPGAGVPANFPTVFDPGLPGPSGPLHMIDTQAGYWLGQNITPEVEADAGADADAINNIVPAANDPDNDGADDGVFGAGQPAIALPSCQLTNFDYSITVAAGGAFMQRFTNVWFDYNRDGDWEDVFACPNGFIATEWAVQDQVTGVGPGMNIITTPDFRPRTPQNGCLWMRISLTDVQVPLAGNGRADGRGPGVPYPDGETEDYRLMWTGQAFEPVPDWACD